MISLGGCRYGMARRLLPLHDSEAVAMAWLGGCRHGPEEAVAMAWLGGSCHNMDRRLPPLHDSRILPWHSLDDLTMASMTRRM